MPSRSALARYRVYEEPDGSFGIDGTGTLANFLDVRSMESPFVHARASLPDQRVRAYRVDQPKDQFGFRSATWDWSGHLISHGTSLTSGATPPSIDGLGTILKATMGGRSVAAGSTVAASPSPTTTGFTVGAGHGSRVTAGKIIWVADSLGRYHPGKVKTVSTDAVTLACALSFTPAAGAVVLNSETFYETDAPETSLQFITEGENRNGDCYILLGCHGSLSLGLSHGQLAMVSGQWQVAKWLQSSASAGDPVASASLSHSLTGSAPVPFTASSAIFAPSGATTRVAPIVESLALNLNFVWQAVPSLNGVDGVAERVRVSSEVTAVVTVAIDDSNPDIYVNARDAGTTYQLLVNLNDQTGGALLAVEMGTVQIRDVKPTMKNGLRYQEVTVLALPDDNATDKTTDIRRSPVRIARG